MEVPKTATKEKVAVARRSIERPLIAHSLREESLAPTARTSHSDLHGSASTS